MGRDALRRLAPELYKIASRKRRTVFMELHDERWVRALAQMTASNNFGNSFTSVGCLLISLWTLTEMAPSLGSGWLMVSIRRPRLIRCNSSALTRSSTQPCFRRPTRSQSAKCSPNLCCVDASSPRICLRLRVVRMTRYVTFA